jgi:hypothetical protein
MSNALHSKSAYWIGQGIFDDFQASEARVNKIAEEMDREGSFEIFVEGY